MSTTTNRHSTLSLGGESMTELHALQQREALRHDVDYANAVARLWSLFAKDAQGLVHKESYLAGLSRFCQVLMPNLPMAEALDLATNDWQEDVEQYSTDGTTLDFDGFYLAMAELTDLWCPIADVEDYQSFVDSLFKRATVRVVRDANGHVVRRDLAQSEYVFVENVVTTPTVPTKIQDVALGGAGTGPGTAQDKENDDAEANGAAIKMQAVQRGRSSRRVARDKWVTSLSGKYNPTGLDLRRSCTKHKEKQSKQALVDQQEQEDAARRMQSITRGRAAREQVRVKKLQRQYSQFIPVGMDLGRPAMKKKQDREDQEKSALLMQGLARQRTARQKVQQRRSEVRSAAASSLLTAAAVTPLKKKAVVGQELSGSAPGSAPSSHLVNGFDLRRPSSKKKASLNQFELQGGTYHEMVDYGSDTLQEVRKCAICWWCCCWWCCCWLCYCWLCYCWLCFVYVGGTTVGGITVG